MLFIDHHGLGDVVVVVDVPWNGPQEAAVFKRSTLHLAGGSKDDLFLAGQRRGEGGHVGLIFGFGFPKKIAGQFIEGHQGGFAARPHAGGDDQGVTFHPGRSACAEHQITGFKAFMNVQVPKQFAGHSIEAMELTFGTEGVKPAIIVGGPGARAYAAHVIGVIKFTLILMPPKPAAVSEVVAGDHLAAIPLLQREESALGDGDAGVSAADHCFPNLFGRRVVPVRANGRAGVHPIALGAAVAGPERGSFSLGLRSE